MGRILRKLHLFIFIYICWSTYNSFMVHLEKMESMEQERPSLKIQITKLKKRVEQAEIFKANLEESKQRIKDVARDIEQVQKQLPSEIKDTDILDRFSKEADIMNIKNIFLKPGNEIKKDFYFSKDYELKASGTFLQFLVYFERLANSDRLINITELSMTRSDKRKRGRFQMVDVATKMEIFRYDPKFKESTGIKEIETKFRTKKRGKS